MFKCNIVDFQKPPFDVEEYITNNEVKFINNFNEDLDELNKADSIHVWHKKIGKSELDKMNSLKLIVRMGVGYDAIDIEECSRRGIKVAIIPDYGTNEVADLCFGHMLNLTRNIYSQTSDYLNKNVWNAFNYSGSLRLQGKTLGIIGLGRIGKAVALRAKAFGLDIVFYDPFIEDGIDKTLGVKRVEELEKLVSLSDIVSIHCPLTELSGKMFNREIFSHFKERTILINTARGGIVDPTALFEAVKNNKILGLGLDVYKTEPPREEDEMIQYIKKNSLINSFRVSITHHSGFYTEESLIELREKAALETLNFLKKGKLRNPVN